MQIYTQVIDRINKAIKGFNEQLSEKHAIPALGSATDIPFMNISKTPWDQQFWPNKDAKGVYFLFGFKESEPSNPAIYIGKASLGNIGDRLYSHLNPSRNEACYRVNDGAGAPCVIELVASIDLSTRHDSSLAVALEEYLIKELRSSFYLINSVGNKRE